MRPHQLFGKDPEVVTPVRRRQSVEACDWLARTGRSVSGWYGGDTRCIDVRCGTSFDKRHGFLIIPSEPSKRLVPRSIPEILNARVLLRSELSEHAILNRR